MTEDFVSYEQAVKLYNLDFDWNCERAYYIHSWMKEPRLVHFTIAYKEQRNYDGTDVYPAPSPAQAQKWLREVKELHVQVAPCRDDKTEKISWRMVGVYGIAEFMGTTDFVVDVPYSEIDYPSYEAALSSGISAALELIEKKGE